MSFNRFLFRLLAFVLVAVRPFEQVHSAPLILGPITDGSAAPAFLPPPKVAANFPVSDELEPFNSFDSQDYRPLDYGYLPGGFRYLGNRLKGSGYTSLHGLNYESVGFRNDYYTAEAYPQLVGHGQVRVNGQEAELTCQFPQSLDLVSVRINIVITLPKLLTNK